MDKLLPRYYEDTAVYDATIDDIDMDAVDDYAKLDMRVLTRKWAPKWTSSRMLHLREPSWTRSRKIEFIETQVREHTFLEQHAQFVTKRDYPEFVIQEMTVNACCHLTYNIKGTEIQISLSLLDKGGFWEVIV